jgi:hypothetical protein
MIKFSFLVFVVILLVACQSSATPLLPSTQTPLPSPTSTQLPTPTPEESLAESVDDLVGIWWFPQGPIFIEMKADGTYRVWDNSGTGNQAAGEFTFDSGKVTWVTSQPACNDRPATYEMYVMREKGKVVQIRMKVVGTDPCFARTDNVMGVGRLYNP